MTKLTAEDCDLARIYLRKMCDGERLLMSIPAQESDFDLVFDRVINAAKDMLLKPKSGAADAAYEERNRVVSALAKCFPSGVGKTAIEGWDEAWHNCVYIDLPTGQASWHFHDREAHLFEGLPKYEKPWDGHSTPEKYRRLESLSAKAKE